MPSTTRRRPTRSRGNRSLGTIVSRSAEQFASSDRSLLDQTIDRPPAGTSKNQRGEAREVEQVGFIARLAEMRAAAIDRLQLDRAEPIGQMHGEDRNQQNDSHRNAGK